MLLTKAEQVSDHRSARPDYAYCAHAAAVAASLEQWVVRHREPTDRPGEGGRVARDLRSGRRLVGAAR